MEGSKKNLSSELVSLKQARHPYLWALNDALRSMFRLVYSNSEDSKLSGRLVNSKNSKINNCRKPAFEIKY